MFTKGLMAWRLTYGTRSRQLLHRPKFRKLFYVPSSTTLAPVRISSGKQLSYPRHDGNGNEISTTESAPSLLQKTHRANLIDEQMKLETGCCRSRASSSQMGNVLSSPQPASNPASDRIILIASRYTLHPLQCVLSNQVSSIPHECSGA